MTPLQGPIVGVNLGFRALHLSTSCLFSSPFIINQPTSGSNVSPLSMDNSQQQQSIRFAKKQVSRKRATKACLKCRKRKVRCDVTRTSTPCTNCRLDGCECVVARRADALYVVSLSLFLLFLTYTAVAQSPTAPSPSPQMTSSAIARPSRRRHHQHPAMITRQLPSKRLPPPYRI